MTKIQRPTSGARNIGTTTKTTSSKPVTKVESAPQVTAENNALDPKAIEAIREQFKHDPAAAVEQLNRRIIASHPLGNQLNAETLHKITSKVTQMILNHNHSADFLEQLLGDKSPK
ncbi:hypothetical protein [Vibrio sp. MEBiC08052]|uniref:hypothetical protein n=1 Tax=Vibrio sp. MEBiC08052 TaxID=1761910 RepID=UPI0007405BF1|nr:hypothetical protein [Vibrio sp. MEBiC08052]KUI97004.1 hypothetical protein VRK_38590 [Vibrio sp. MEBiC08052]